jgi:hypothetical protein
MLRQRFAQTNHERNISIKAHCMLCCISSEQECLLSLSLFFLTLLLVCKKINNKVVFWKFYENTYFLLEIEWNFSHGTFFVYIKVQSSFFFFLNFFTSRLETSMKESKRKFKFPSKDMSLSLVCSIYSFGDYYDTVLCLFILKYFLRVYFN